MLYRFREAKAAELGIAGRGDKRPRLASSCKSLRDCERWRGEILREISRKVSKIHDSASLFSCRSLVWFYRTTKELGKEGNADDDEWTSLVLLLSSGIIGL